MAKNLNLLKKAIFLKLSTDSILVDLLGGAGRIFHRNPPKDASYPCLAYNIISDRDNPFDETGDSGDITETHFRITLYEGGSQTTILDNIESRVKELLHGQRTLDTTDIICYSCFRDRLTEPIKDPELLIWFVPIRYRIRWAQK